MSVCGECGVWWVWLDGCGCMCTLYALKLVCIAVWITEV